MINLGSCRGPPAMPSRTTRGPRTPGWKPLTYCTVWGVSFITTRCLFLFISLLFLHPNRTTSYNTSTHTPHILMQYLLAQTKKNKKLLQNIKLSKRYEYVRLNINKQTNKEGPNWTPLPPHTHTHILHNKALYTHQNWNSIHHLTQRPTTNTK